MCRAFVVRDKLNGGCHNTCLATAGTPAHRWGKRILLETTLGLQGVQWRSPAEKLNLSKGAAIWQYAHPQNVALVFQTRCRYSGTNVDP